MTAPFINGALAEIISTLPKILKTLENSSRNPFLNNLRKLYSEIVLNKLDQVKMLVGYLDGGNPGQK